MSSGGARNRSGPQADPNSERSDLRGYSLTALPSEGYAGPVPEFPLPDASVAMWTRLSVRCEDPEAGAALYAQLHRFADQIGMTTAGLAEMGWRVKVDEVAVKREANAVAPAAAPVRRMRAVGDGG